MCFVAINLKKSLVSTAAKFRCAGPGGEPRGSYGFRNTLVTYSDLKRFKKSTFMVKHAVY